MLFLYIAQTIVLSANTAVVLFTRPISDQNIHLFILNLKPKTP